MQKNGNTKIKETKGGNDMLHILPASDLKEDFEKIENLVEKQGQTIYLTKNGYGSMVMMDFETYEKILEKEETIAKTKNKMNTVNTMNTKKINIPQTEIMDD